MAASASTRPPALTAKRSSASPQQRAPGVKLSNTAVERCPLIFTNACTRTHETQRIRTHHALLTRLRLRADNLPRSVRRNCGHGDEHGTKFSGRLLRVRPARPRIRLSIGARLISPNHDWLTGCGGVR